MTKFHDKDPASTKRSLLQWSSVHKFSWYHNHKGFNGLFYCLLRTYVYHQSRNSQFSRYLNFNSEINTSDFCFRIQSLCLQSLYTKKWQNIIYFLNIFFFQIDNIFIFPLPNLITLITKEWIRVMMFNVAFNTVSLILWRSVLLGGGGQEYPKKTTDLPQVTDKLYHIILYRVHLALARFELTTLVVDMQWLHR